MANFTTQQVYAMMPVRNEAGRFLPLVLKRLSQLVAGIVILDDASDDATPDLCKNEPAVIKYHRLPSPLFMTNESNFRQMLWDMTVQLKPDWIMAVDADEIFENTIHQELPLLLKTDADLVRFPIIHFWGDLCHYRVDGWWNPIYTKTACLYRYRPGLTYHWSNRRLHCGRFPIEAYMAPATTSRTRLLHLGYARKEEHPLKLRRYLENDPNGRFCPVSHYNSIVASRPKLRPWRGESI